jgi:prepilin-type N-terminal cleavage/methylation domain-containing protein
MTSRTRGFTIIELLVSMALLGLISVYLTGMLTQQNRAYTVIDQVSEAQTNQRAIAAIIERDVRSTAGLVWEGAAACGVDNTTAPDILYVTDIDSLQLNSTLNYEMAASIENGFDGGGTDLIRLASLNVDGTPFYDADGDGSPDADFREGAGVIVLDEANPGRGTVCGVITADGIDPAARTIEVDFSAAAVNLGARPPVSNEPRLVAVPAHRYQVDDENRLLRNDMVLADDVEDLQVSYRFDTDEDGTLEDAEQRGQDGSALYTSDAHDHGTLREIRFSFVTRSRRPDPNLTGATFQVLENRDPIAGTDGFRRRPYSAAVRIRNVGHRWQEGS